MPRVDGADREHLSSSLDEDRRALPFLRLRSLSDPRATSSADSLRGWEQGRVSSGPLTDATFLVPVIVFSRLKRLDGGPSDMDPGVPASPNWRGASELRGRVRETLGPDTSQTVFHGLWGRPFVDILGAAACATCCSDSLLHSTGGLLSFFPFGCHFLVSVSTG